MAEGLRRGRTNCRRVREHVVHTTRTYRLKERARVCVFV